MLSTLPLLAVLALGATVPQDDEVDLSRLEVYLDKAVNGSAYIRPQAAARLKHPGGIAALVAILAILGAQPAVFARIVPEKPKAPTVTHDGTDPYKNLPSDGMSLGPKDAPLQVEEFSDFECPHCQRMHEVVIAAILKHRDKIRVTHRDYPLDQSCNRKITIIEMGPEFKQAHVL